MTLTVETGSVAHADLLAALHATSFERPWDAAFFGRLLTMPGSRALLARDGDRPLGFLLLRAAAGEAEIVTFCVSPESRGRGIGARLLDAAVAAAREVGAERLLLEVAADNDAARTLYAGRRFVEAGRRPGYYRRADGRAADALTLAMML